MTCTIRQERAVFKQVEVCSYLSPLDKEKQEELTGRMKAMTHSKGITQGVQKSVSVR